MRNSMATHLAPDELLADYASGAATPGVALLVATHLTHAPQSRARLDAMESVGGAVLKDAAAAELSNDALSATLAMLDEEGTTAANAPAGTGHASGPLPAIVVDAFGSDFDDIPWKFQLPGLSAAEFDGFGDEKVILLRARPGAKIPQHTHEGSELTLVLTGCLSDGGVDYRKGDIAMNDEHDDHRPQITGDEVCYCLVVQQGALRFTGTFSKVLNYLGE